MLLFLHNNVSILWILSSDLVTNLIDNEFDYHLFTAYYIQQCKRSDPNVDQCLKSSANKFARYVQKGIPELEIEEVGDC